MDFGNVSDKCEISAEQYVIATSYLAISLFYCVPYILCVMIIMTDTGLRSQQYYRIVANMGITDILQLTFNGMFAGILTYTCVDFGQSTAKMWINKIIGGVMNFNWVIYCFFAHLLAFNRFCHIFFHTKINSIFSRQNTNIMLSVVWIYGFGWLIAYFVPDFNLLYYVKEYKWDYDEIPLSRKAWLSELVSDMFHATGMIMWYACILIKLRMKMDQIQNQQMTAQDRKERRVLMQAILVCMLTMLTLVGFFLIPQIMDNRWANFISNLIWLCCAGNNAIIYIILNSTINRKFKKFVFEGKNVFKTKIVPTKVSIMVQHLSTMSSKTKDTSEKRLRLTNQVVHA